MTFTAKAKNTPQTKPVFGQRIAVIGAGIVGVCAALELQKRGAQVVLVDRREPGQETSYGNAGVISRSSLIPLNNPGLLGSLPGYLANNKAGLRYDLGFLAQNAGWAAQFLRSARPSIFEKTVSALDSLIRLSVPEHLHLIAEGGHNDLLSDQGWLCLYRSLEGFERTAANREVMASYDVATSVLTNGEVQELEPGLSDIFPRALWVRDCHTVSDPGALVRGYAAQFVAQGGEIKKAEIQALKENEDGVEIQVTDAPPMEVDETVLCLGPWGRIFLERLGYRVRMAYERGYHRHYSGFQKTGGNRGLTRPIYDTAAGYVLAPMQQGLRLSTGVELTDQAAPPNYQQIEQVERSAREAVDLGDAVEETPWLGSRPTFPDSRPAIGRLPEAKRISINFGHQHIGLLTAPGSGKLLADLMEAQAPEIDSEPFAPERVIQKV